MKVSTINPKTDGFEAEFKIIDEDQMAMRVVEVEGQKRKFNLVQDPHFALWTIKPTIGYVPEELSGQYTSEKNARQAIEIYLGKQEKIDKEAKALKQAQELAEKQALYAKMEAANVEKVAQINKQEAAEKVTKSNAKVKAVSIA